MKTDRFRVGEKRRVNGEKRGFGRKARRRRVSGDSAAIQRLFEASRAIFKGPGTVPPPRDVTTMHILLEKMRAEDFGLSADLQFFKARDPAEGESPSITFTTIYNCDKFSICMFFLPPGAVMPLHNHPGMTVFSKLLLGSMHIKSYDWVDADIAKDSTPSSKFRLAKLVVDSDFTAPCKTSTLYPAAGGNLHTFRSITSCVVLDVQGPPYSKEEDHDCTYYREHPYPHLLDGDVAGAGEPDDRISWLEEIEIPSELNMVPVEYRGPQIIDW